MKTNRFTTSKIILILMLGLVTASFLFTGCKKSSDDSSTPTNQMYTNMNDDSTTQIVASIPRLELKQVKSTNVTLYLSVTDQNGHAFGSFNQYNFVIKLVCVGSTDTTVLGSYTFQKMNQSGQNIATPLILDYSGSMSSYTSDLEYAAGTFIRMKNGNDQVELIKFSSDIEMVQAFTKDTTTLLSKLYASWAGAGSLTAFYDAVILGIDDANTFVNTSSTTYLPALIGFTDGLDNESVNTQQNVIDQAKMKGIPLYMLGFGSANPTILTNIAESTGGRYYYTPDATTLANLFAMISGQLKNVYLAQWNLTVSGCNQVMIVVDATYTAKKGTFKSHAQKVFTPFK